MAHQLIRIVLLLCFIGMLVAVDWPMYRNNAQRSASTEAAIVAKAAVAWTRQLPAIEMAWPFEKRLQFDKSYEPIIVGDQLIMAITSYDEMVSYNLKTGAEQWRFYANGPIRFAPVAYNEKIFFGSDDGNFYCINAQTGKLLHKYNCNPNGRMLLGNNRYISNMPVRGGAVLENGIIYFTAGVWPNEGVSIYAMDANSFAIKWVNNTAHLKIIPHAHGSMAYGGVAPQGYLAVMGDTLFVANGRARPIRFNKSSGELLDYDTGWHHGTWQVCGTEKYYINGSLIFNTANGFLSQNLNIQIREPGRVLKTGPHEHFQLAFPVIDGNRIFAAKNGIAEWDAASIPLKAEVTNKVRYNYEHKQYEKDGLEPKTISENKKIKRVWLSASNGLLASTDSNLLCIDKDGKELWSLELGTALGSVIAVDNYIVAVGVNNELHVISESGSDKVYKQIVKPLSNKNTASVLLKDADQSEGYCLVLGLENEQLFYDLVTQSQMRVIGMSADAKKVQSMKRRLQAAHIYGTRASVICIDPAHVVLSEYMCNLVVVNGDLVTEINALNNYWTAVRPYGGVLAVAKGHGTALKDFKDPQVKRKDSAAFELLKREGPIPGTAAWTHEWGNAGNSMATEDDRVAAPFGVMWYGGDADGYMFTDRHRGAPRPLVIEGRVILTIPNKVYAYDAYTGRVLWNYSLPGYAEHFNTPWQYNPRASYILGGSIAAIDGAIYIHNGKEIHVLDSKTGKQVTVIKEGIGKSVGHIVCYKDYLVTLTETYASPRSYSADQFPNTEAARGLIKELSEGLKKHQFPKRGEGESDAIYVARMLNSLLETTYRYSDYPKYQAPPNGENLYQQAKGANRGLESIVVSKQLDEFSFKSQVRTTNLIFLGLWFDAVPQYQVAGRNHYIHGSAGALTVFNRKTGKRLWSRPAELGFRHAAVCAGGDRVYCVDLMPPEIVKTYRRLGKTPTTTGTLHALNIHNGNPVWSEVSDATALSYSELHDVLVESYSRDTIGSKEVKECPVRQGKDGSLKYALKSKATVGVLMAGDFLLLGHWATDINTGKGQGWMVSRDRGCNPLIGSKHVVTFRSSAAGVFDIKNRTGTSNLGGVRSDCSGSIIPANGILNMPKMASGCGCNYPTQCSMAMIYRQGYTTITYGGFNKDDDHFGINIGAFGDTLDTKEFIWYEYPLQSAKTYIKNAEDSKSKYPGVDIIGDVKYIADNINNIEEGNKYVASSRAEGMSSILLKKGRGFRKNTVDLRLYFVEPSAVKSGERVFSISVQNKELVKDLDIFKETGGQHKMLVKEIKGLTFEGQDLKLEFTSSKGSALPSLICGIELSKPE